MERAEGIKWNTCLTSRWFIYLYLLILQLAFPFSWALHSSWESYDEFCHQSKYFFRRYWIAMDIKIVAVLISSLLFLKLNNWSILILLPGMVSLNIYRGLVQLPIYWKLLCSFTVSLKVKSCEIRIGVVSVSITMLFQIEWIPLSAFNDEKMWFW